jgi:hypothetical protein
MKLNLFIILSACLLISCHKDEERLKVKACFTYNPTEVTTGEVQFTNCSENATGYLWDFGDGETSHEKSPKHKFNGSFPYTVTLTAYHGNRKDTLSKQLTSEIIVYKPNIYLYPLSRINLCINIRFPLGGSILTSEPDYGEGWCVDIDTSGMIDNQYNYLFYESRQPDVFQYDQGWCVAGTELKAFFERNMTQYNFSPREIKDFTDYWIPEFTTNKFYLIYPQTNGIIDRAIRLDFSIQPTNIFRLFYGITGVEEYKRIEEPSVVPCIRRGFFVVEWGVFKP